MGTLVTTSVDKARVKSILPDWFKTETGFRFLYGRDEAVVIGFGGYRTCDGVGSIQLYKTKDRPAVSEALFTIEMHKPTLVIAYLYKGEWHLSDVEKIIHAAEEEGKTVNDVFQGHPTGECVSEENVE